MGVLKTTALSIAVLVSLGLTGCAGNQQSSPGSPTATTTARSAGSDRDVTFTSGPVTIYGSLRMPDGVSGAVPGVLLIAGSGPTDRNGDNNEVPGSIGTLRYLAEQLAHHGIASLRYDKLGTGQTALGPYHAQDFANIGYNEFLNEAAAGVNFLASQPGIDKSKIALVGHSEGAVVALALANGRGGQIPGPIALGLIEPLSTRILDLMYRQIDTQIDAAVAAGAMTRADGDRLHAQLVFTITDLRVGNPIPDDLPAPLRNAGFVPTNSKSLLELDELSPIDLARQVHAPMRVFTSCSDKDIQVSCTDVDGLNFALAQTAHDTVHLATADHVLKDVGSQPSTGEEYGQPLPFSEQFGVAFGKWADQL